MNESEKRITAILRGAVDKDGKVQYQSMNDIIKNPNSMKEAIDRINARYHIRIGEMRYKV